MSKYVIVQKEEKPSEEASKPVKPPPKIRRKSLIKPAGDKEHQLNPIPPKLRSNETEATAIPPIEKQKSLTVALIGPPNAGKSTLLNHFIQDKVTATSSKAQTTRSQIIASTTIGETQIVFVDTPGIVDKPEQKSIQRSLVVSGWSALRDCDVVLVMSDMKREFDTARYANLYHTLNNLRYEIETSKSDKPFEVVLILNKLDLVLPEKKRAFKLDTISAELNKDFPFLKRFFCISALNEVNLGTMKDYLLSKARPRAWEYSPDAKCVMSDYQRAMEVIREKIYRRYNKEIPYLIEQKNIDWSELDSGVTCIENILYVPKQSQLNIVVGAGGRSLKYICMESENSLKEIFGKPFKVVLTAKLKKSSNSMVGAGTNQLESLLGYRLTPPRTMADLMYTQKQ